MPLLTQGELPGWLRLVRDSLKDPVLERFVDAVLDFLDAVLDFLGAVRDFPGRVLSAVPRRHRCQVCRSRMSSKSYGPNDKRCPAEERVYLKDEDGREPKGVERGYARYLCEECDRRNAEARAAKEKAWAQQKRRTVGRCTTWLRKAPLLTHLPDPVGDFVGIDRRSFVQIVDLAVAARQASRAILGISGRYGRPPFQLEGDTRFDADGKLLDTPRPPTSYRDVLRFRHPRRINDPHDHTELIEWTGSIYRLDGDRIVLHWHTWKVLRVG